MNLSSCDDEFKEDPFGLSSSDRRALDFGGSILYSPLGWVGGASWEMMRRPCLLSKSCMDGSCLMISAFIVYCSGIQQVSRGVTK